MKIIAEKTCLTQSEMIDLLIENENHREEKMTTEELAEKLLKRFEFLEERHKERIRIINRNYYITIGLLLFVGIGIPILQVVFDLTKS